MEAKNVLLPIKKQKQSPQGLSAQCVNLSSIPRIHMVGRENLLLEVVLSPPHVYHGAHFPAHTEINVNFVLKKPTTDESHGSRHNLAVIKK